ncbi:hypothetical protein GN244_ATG01841 [Phytophthora infestans]|nr:hypothetical protein GN244_ATG01841 [Phytophthora infestans]
MCDQPLQAEVELSLDPGGDKFRASFDYSQAPQWMLACVTLLAVAGLINAIWVAAAIEGDTTVDIKGSSTAKESNAWQDEEFSFFLMEEDEPK